MPKTSFVTRPAINFALTLTITHPALDEPAVHVDILQAVSRSAALKQLALDERKKCQLKNSGSTSWIDENDAIHKLELEQLSNEEEEKH